MMWSIQEGAGRVMRFKAILPPPGWSGRWFAGVMAGGFVVPTIIAASIMAAGFHPIGSAFPRSMFWSEFGVTLTILGVISVITAAAPMYSLLAWSWRPLALVATFICGVAIGSIPGMTAGRYVKAWAMDSVSRRSQPLVEAITRYTQVTGTPPASLAELVPEYLPSIPTTSMAVQAEYHYEPGPGPCSVKNGWYLSIWFPEFLMAYRLLYCPQQDYGYVDTFDSSRWREMFGTWMYDLVAF